MAPTQAIQLCESCRKVDFAKLAWLDGPLETDRDVTSSEPPAYCPNIGSVEEIQSRQDQCVLCRAISQRIEEADRPGEGSGRCSLKSAIFCKQRYPWWESENRCTARAAVIVTSASPANEKIPRSETDARVVLQLQPCVQPVPTVRSTCMDIPDGLDATHAPWVSGRLMDTEKVDIRLLSRWLFDCEVQHKECRRAYRPVPLVSMLLIDVERACIVDAPASCRYVALSYVWGPRKDMFLHTQANSILLRKEGSLDGFDIPLTIRDAMSLVRDMKEPYLWVDALCIVQDNHSIQASQISQMASIYSQALFTIIAAAGDDANTGLPGVRPGTRHIRQEIIDFQDWALIAAIDGPYYGGIGASRWVSRAWTLQEHALSRRNLIFSEQQVYWRCQGPERLEEIALESFTPCPSFEKIPGDTGPNEIELDTIVSPLEYYSSYEYLVKTYMRRHLTYASDMLNGLEGMLSVLSSIAHDEFIWGLPESQFAWAMEWSMRGRTRNRAARPVKSENGPVLSIPFPSWSWTAWTCGSDLPSIYWQGQETHGGPVEPEIILYRSDIGGRLLRIQGRRWISPFRNIEGDDDDLFSPSMHPSNDVRDQWKGEPEFIEGAYDALPDGEFIDSGILHFWTSVATIYIRRFGRDSSGNLDYPAGPKYLTVSVDDHDSCQHIGLTEMNSTDHLGWKNPDTTKRLPKKLQARVDDDPDSDILIADFLIVGASVDYGERYLRGLIVEWKDDVGYRLGCFRVAEENWVELKGREWKLVKLG